MLPRSAKNKGKLLQNLVRDSVLKAFPQLTNRDCTSTIMGESGDDIKLSEAGFKLFPYSVEAKSLKKVAIYKYYNQRGSPQGERLLVVKQNNEKPLAIVSLDHFMELVKCQNKT